jgi:Cu+-exporting ATPase
LNQFLKKNILQNKGLLMYSSLACIAFIVSFSIAGIAVSPIIPLMIMISTTLMVLFNSYRVQLAVDTALDPKTSWLKRLLASDASIGLLVGSTLLFMCGLLISTVATGGLAIPALVFTAGAALVISNVCLLAAAALSTLFILLVGTYLLFDKYLDNPKGDAPANGPAINTSMANMPKKSFTEDNKPTPTLRKSATSQNIGDTEFSQSDCSKNDTHWQVQVGDAVPSLHI